MSFSSNISRDSSRDKSSGHDNTGSLPRRKRRRKNRHTQPPPRQPPPAGKYSPQNHYLQQQYLLQKQYLEEKYQQQKSLEEKYSKEKYLLQQQYLNQHGALPPPLPQQWIPGQSLSRPQSPPGQSLSSSSSINKMQHGQMTSSSPFSLLSEESHEVHADPIIQPQPIRRSVSGPSSQRSPQEVWVTIQNYSMFLNTMPLRPHTRSYMQQPFTQRFFTLCSLAKCISQFDLTYPDASEKVKTNEEYILYRNAYSSFPPATLTVTMTLYFMLHAPQIYLPLAPFRKAIYNVIEFAYTFQLAHWKYNSSFDVICRMVTGILTMRIRHAVNHVYPHLKVGSSGGSVPQVEHDKPPILEWLARDTLAAFNPIEIMLVYYRPIMTEFNEITNPTLEDCVLSFQKVKWIAGWFREMHSVCIMYGLHIYDSQWVSIDEWTELAGYMDIISTKMAPDLFDVVQGKHPAPTTDEEHRNISSTKDWYEAFLCCLAPCFTHHYRPMRKPRRFKVPFGNWPTSGTFFCSIPPRAYSNMMANLPTALEQYATMYVEDPTQFECGGSQAASQRASPSHHGTNGGSLRTITPSSIRPTFDDIINKTSPKPEKGVYTFTNNYKQLGLELPIYSHTLSQIQHLLRSIRKYPPMNDPVYALFTPWFAHVSKHMHIMTPDGTTKLQNPAFTYRR